METKDVFVTLRQEDMGFLNDFPGFISAFEYHVAPPNPYEYGMIVFYKKDHMNINTEIRLRFLGIPQG